MQPVGQLNFQNEASGFALASWTLQLPLIAFTSLDVQLAVLILAGGLFGILLIALWSN